MIKKIFFKGPFKPIHSENKMASEGSVEKSRDYFIKHKFRNLDFLLEKRYGWMNNYITGKKKIIEIGSGSGFSKLYLKEKVILSDATKNPWIDKYIDATKMDLPDHSVDILIASHNIHHFYSPYKFFNEANRVLKKGGLLLIQEINTSLLMRFLLKIMKHEGWSYEVNVFHSKEIVNDKDDLWSANCAVPEMLFSNEKKFFQTFPFFEFKKNTLNECLIFPFSGGVISKTKIPELPLFFLKLLDFIDNLLIYFFPKVFGLGRSVVLKKK
jgi:SAM-dependent methyltransferase